MTGDPFTVAELRAARQALAPYIVETPIQRFRADEITRVLGAEADAVLKLELFQRTGTFKPRGALTVMLSLAPDALARGVTAVSAGNHAIAVAYAARALGTSAKVVMLATANPARVESCRRYGAELVIAPDGKTAFAIAQAIAEDEGRSFVHPFEGPLTALGAATVGLEFSEQAGMLDAVVIPVGGGGLCAGVASAFKLLQPSCRIYGVEPEGAASMSRSFAAGAPVAFDTISTIADSLAPPFSLPYSFALCRRALDDLVTVSDDAMRAGMELLFREMKLAVEPAGAAATAAALGPLADRLRGRRVGIVVCGANIDIASFARHITQAQASPPAV